MGFCNRKGVECECLSDHSTCNSDNCHRRLPDIKIRKDKFTINLVWHNCKTYPPEEKWNVNLYATDGRDVFKVVYDYREGWFMLISNRRIPTDELDEFWWADLQQTINTSDKFDVIRRIKYGEEGI